jgi:hypothetical protein
MPSFDAIRKGFRISDDCAALVLIRAEEIAMSEVKRRDVLVGTMGLTTTVLAATAAEGKDGPDK